MLNNQHGFSLIELMVVVAILGILSTMALYPLITMRARGADAAAISDARNLVDAVNENFIRQSYPDFRIRNGNKIGLNPDGTYAFTLSEDVNIITLVHTDLTDIALMKDGILSALLYHVNGSTDSTNPFAAMTNNRRVFWIYVDELAGITSAPAQQ